MPEHEHDFDHPRTADHDHDSWPGKYDHQHNWIEGWGWGIIHYDDDIYAQLAGSLCHTGDHSYCGCTDPAR